MEAIVRGLAHVKKATGIATAASWILLGLAYLAALAFGTFGTFSLGLYTSLYEKSSGLLGEGFGLFMFFAMIFFYPIGDEKTPLFEKLMGAFMKSMGVLIGLAIALLLVGVLLQFAFELMLAFARWLHHEGIPAWKEICKYISVGWFVLMALCLAGLLALRRNEQALKVILELILESVQEVFEFFIELVVHSRKGPGG
ncbi:hypothetical protein [Ramlibacter sp. PS4R-6]|uniref:hypothetical protein n=1 Tax=Ramlibacter sp. PS4R-6 TaxID=3133438 RepID=UPI003099A658